jgi:hypothetical protein
MNEVTREKTKVEKVMENGTDAERLLWYRCVPRMKEGGLPLT